MKIAPVLVILVLTLALSPLVSLRTASESSSSSYLTLYGSTSTTLLEAQSYFYWSQQPKVTTGGGGYWTWQLNARAANSTFSGSYWIQNVIAVGDNGSSDFSQLINTWYGCENNNSGEIGCTFNNNDYYHVTITSGSPLTSCFELNWYMTDVGHAIYDAVAYLDVTDCSTGSSQFSNQETMSEYMYSISDVNLVTVGYPWVAGGNPAHFSAGDLSYDINDAGFGSSLYYTNSYYHYNFDATGESSNMCSHYSSGSGNDLIDAYTDTSC